MILTEKYPRLTPLVKLKSLAKWLRPPVGVRGERLAARHLRRAGYRVLARNLRNRFGEVDILAEAPDGRTVVIVEVKSQTPRATDDTTATTTRPTAPEARVGQRKRRKLVGLACQVARQYRLTDRPIRFDVMGVDIPARGRAVVRHYVAAFESHV